MNKMYINPNIIKNWENENLFFRTFVRQPFSTLTRCVAGWSKNTTRTTTVTATTTTTTVDRCVYSLITLQISLKMSSGSQPRCREVVQRVPPNITFVYQMLKVLIKLVIYQQQGCLKVVVVFSQKGLMNQKSSKTHCITIMVCHINN